MTRPLPRIAAIHDLSAYGRCSLTVVIPILSRMGFEVCPLPTAVLSTHTAFPEYYFIDLTDKLEAIIDHWKKLGLKFDAIYSGFLGSAQQVDIVSDFIKHFKSPETLVVVDTVMADHGELYPSMTSEMVSGMRKLSSLADVLTPNITEAAFLLDRKVPESLSPAQAQEWLKDLSKLGPKMPIITSLPLNSNLEEISVAAYDAKADCFWSTSRKMVPKQYHGTGDMFSSVLTGSLLQGDSLPQAIDRSAQLVYAAIKDTFGYGGNKILGHDEILLERSLSLLGEPIEDPKFEPLQ